LLLLLLLIVETLWGFVDRHIGRFIEPLSLFWMVSVSIVLLFCMRSYIGTIGTFAFRWAAFAMMLLVALMGERARRHQKLRLAAMEHGA
ncbi:MAG: hypothetical protein HY270_14865, partial [Deltaproteobacteria bacterium]|nr:hypothetical protein [Deltaproteobacteria bacterium]